MCAKRTPVPAAGLLNEDKKKNSSALTHGDLFDHVAGAFKTKAAFQKAVDVYVKSEVRRRGHVEFIYAALKKMPEFGVERDLAVYNKLLDVFPKEVFVPRNFIQRMFNHYPRQQECGVQLLEQMENYGKYSKLSLEVNKRAGDDLPVILFQVSCPMWRPKSCWSKFLERKATP